ncbi:uncharacterized protein BDW43DRAFT_179055 [Aspergillus alliaceus]|uniref:uncharacterized protein n=1 Tax=Petromyces alliaceus TaxID=209559 RepID=UPI0012A44A09|nr:uncharacterized protein BDW43DRAFT_179055 [Aspergillus alliaceus]KAB8237491.1 hypothetical protein BDW43DRAFT_179055 [Aspergillus alliaceus]
MWQTLTWVLRLMYGSTGASIQGTLLPLVIPVTADKHITESDNGDVELIAHPKLKIKHRANRWHQKGLFAARPSSDCVRHAC